MFLGFYEHSNSDYGDVKQFRDRQLIAKIQPDQLSVLGCPGLSSSCNTCVESTRSPGVMARHRDHSLEVVIVHTPRQADTFPDYVSRFRQKMVDIRTRFRETARLGLYQDYWVPPK
ncbi:hypothetical protein RRG08_046926 [Elysia crispata]|uniref:Uncharacterized protein n=1 Tax=Elysia crispata TaxID=231223 RepID=A0AAE1A8U6_9GAST|nr:hypothetical protein RRG08_046926 [Elysia crispata]